MKVTIAGVDRSSLYQQDELEAISIELLADQGEVGQGSVPVPDAAGTHEDYAGQQFKLSHGTDIVVDGFLGATDRERNGVMGGSSSRLTHYHHVLDDNALLNGDVAIWSRPAETDYARMMAFNAAFLGSLSLDTTWVLNTHTQTFPAKKYSTEALFGELQDDLGKATGKTLFIERRRLHWHLPTEGIVAGIAIVEAESANWSTSYPLMSRNPPTRSKDAMDLSTSVTAINSKGQTRTATDSTATTRHDSAGLRHHKLVDGADMTTTQLAVLAAQSLADNKAERITYEGEIGPLTTAQLADIPVGSLINVTDHVWGLSSSTQRIAAETLRYVHPDKWMVTIQLGYPIRLRANPPVTTPPPGLTPDGGVPPPYVCIPPDYHVPHCDDAGDTSAIVATAIAGFDSGGSGGISVHGVTLVEGATYHVVYDIVHATTTGECNVDVVMTNGGSLRFGMLAAGHDPAITDGSDPHMVVTHYEFDQLIGSGYGACWQVIVHESAGYAGCNIVGTTVTVTVTWVSGPDSRFDSLEPCPPPLIGQDVLEAGVSGDGVTTTGQTAYPYQPNSLEVFVGGVHVTPEQTDPATGSYTLPMAPPAGVVPVVKYRATGGDATGAGFTDPTSVLELIPDVFLPPSVTTDTGGMVPYYIGPGSTFTVPLYKQALFAEAIEVDGALVVNGLLIGVD